MGRFRSRAVSPACSATSSPERNRSPRASWGSELTLRSCPPSRRPKTNDQRTEGKGSFPERPQASRARAKAYLRGAVAHWQAGKGTNCPKCAKGDRLRRRGVSKKAPDGRKLSPRTGKRDANIQEKEIWGEQMSVAAKSRERKIRKTSAPSFDFHAKLSQVQTGVLCAGACGKCADEKLPI